MTARPVPTLFGIPIDIDFSRLNADLDRRLEEVKRAFQEATKAQRPSVVVPDPAPVEVRPATTATRSYVEAAPVPPFHFEDVWLRPSPDGGTQVTPIPPPPLVVGECSCGQAEAGRDDREGLQHRIFGCSWPSAPDAERGPRRCACGAVKLPKTVGEIGSVVFPGQGVESTHDDVHRRYGCTRRRTGWFADRRHDLNRLRDQVAALEGENARLNLQPTVDALVIERVLLVHEKVWSDVLGADYCRECTQTSPVLYPCRTVTTIVTSPRPKDQSGA